MSAFGERRNSPAVMSAFGGIADVRRTARKNPLIATSGSRAPSLHRIFLCVFGADCFGARLQLLCLVGARSLSEQCCIVFQTLRHIRVLRPQGLLVLALVGFNLKGCHRLGRLFRSYHT